MKIARITLIIGLMAGSFLTFASISRAAESGPKPLMDVYHIHIYDEMEISVYGNDELSETVVVRPDGMMSFPLIGDIYVLGMTTGELRESIEKQLSTQVKAPKVSLLMTRFYKPQVYVLGEIPAPGLYPMPEDASNLIGLLASAKGLDDQILSAEVTLIRGGDVRTIQVKNPPKGFELLPNDVILVKPIKKESITVTGFVNAPGIFPYVDGQTLLDMITRAGGFSADAAQNAVIITRNYPNKPEIINAGNLNRTTGDIPAIRPGDVINVPKRKYSFSMFFMRKILPVARDLAIVSRVF